MDGLVAYGRDIAAEVRRVPSLLMVAVALLLAALSMSSEMVTDVRVAAMSELREAWAAAQASSGGQDWKRVRWGFRDASLEDLEIE